MSDTRASRRIPMIVAGILGSIALAIFGPAAAHAGSAAGGDAPREASTPPSVVAAAPLEDARFAVVQASSPVLVRGKNVVSATRLGTGAYEVVFDRDIRGCAYVATPGNPAGGNPTSGQIAVAQRNNNVNAVYVDTRDSDGVLADRFFHLVVVC